MRNVNYEAEEKFSKIHMKTRLYRVVYDCSLQIRLFQSR